jgi:hypothetical protein
MKNRREFLSVLILLSLLLCFSPGAYTQSARDPERDLHVSFSGRPDGRDFEFVFGEISNQSANRYGCVLLTFNLATSRGSHLGVVSVEVTSLLPRTTQRYEKRLPLPTGQISLKSVSECEVKRLPDAPEILSFTAEPMRINKGETVTLGWRTGNAERVFFGEPNPEWSQNTSSEPIRAPRGVEPSGSLQVHPSQTTVYRLQAQKGGRSTFKDLTVEVTSAPPLPGFCTISGRIDRDRREYRTRVDLYRPDGSGRPLFSTTVNGGQYRFPRVPEGTYRVIPKGNYPTGSGGSGGLAPFPSSPQPVLCQPNGSHRADFKIRSTEG